MIPGAACQIHGRHVDGGARNVNGKFTNVTAATGVGGQGGWWNSIVAGDFRHKGRIDYIVGIPSLFLPDPLQKSHDIL